MTCSLFLIIVFNFITACPHFLQLGVLDGPIFCWINTGCTSIICCVHDDVTQRNYQMNLHVRSCDRNLELKIEQYGFNQSLLDFKYGKIVYCVHRFDGIVGEFSTRVREVEDTKSCRVKKHRL